MAEEKKLSITTIPSFFGKEGISLEELYINIEAKLLSYTNREYPLAICLSSSFEDGTLLGTLNFLELDIDISSTVLAANTQRYLFESNGNIYLAFAGQNNNLNTTIYQINPNPPYNFTLIGPLQNPYPGNPGVVIQGVNSSLNCNTVHFNIDPNPSPTPTPTPSPSRPSTDFRTIYKYLDIQLT
jgi:hypothetical protein